MKTYYFNTGIKCNEIKDFSYDYHRKKGNVISPNNKLLIPFEYEDIPDNYKFEYACDILIEDSNYIVRKINNSNLLSRYAYFKKE